MIHRVGIIPVGETAIYVGVASPHRGEAIALLAEFMDRLKQDVPIWKRRAFLSKRSKVHDPAALAEGQESAAKAATSPAITLLVTLDEALAEIHSHCQPLPAVRAPLAEAFGRVLRETVCAPEDLPDCDRSTRDGYAILQNDASETFQVVDTLHAADWKPRQLKTGETVRVATGAALPCENLRVVMQEHVERDGDQIRIIKREDGAEHPQTRRRCARRDSRSCRPARGWMRASWRCWRRRVAPSRSSARDCASFISRPATKLFRRTRRRSRDKSATAIRF